MPDESSPFGGMVRNARIRAGLTQRELGERAQVSIRAVRDIEQGRVRRPRPDSIRRLATAVGLDPAEALTAARSRPSGTPFADRLEIGVLGPLRVQRAGRPVPLGSLKQRCLLGLLAVQPDRMVGREELIDVLWGEQPPATSQNLVHTYVARLRRTLEPPRRPHASPGTIVAERGGYRLAVDGAALDLRRFDELTTRSRDVTAADPAAALDLATRALECWRGPVLADLTDRLHQHPAVVAAGQRRLAAVLAHADLALAAGRHQPAAEQLRKLIPDEPLHEGLHARLILALAGSGQQAAALKLFTDLRRQLAEELGLESGPELRSAQARVLSGDITTPDTPTPPARRPAAAAPSPAQLPADVAAFTGRTEQVSFLDAALPTPTETPDPPPTNPPPTPSRTVLRPPGPNAPPDESGPYAGALGAGPPPDTSGPGAGGPGAGGPGAGGPGAGEPPDAGVGTPGASRPPGAGTPGAGGVPDTGGPGAGTQRAGAGTPSAGGPPGAGGPGAGRPGAGGVPDTGGPGAGTQRAGAGTPGAGRPPGAGTPGVGGVPDAGGPGADTPGAGGPGAGTPGAGGVPGAGMPLGAWVGVGGSRAAGEGGMWGAGGVTGTGPSGAGALAGGGGSSGTAVVITAIAGMAGVGKTALAVHWAHRVVDRFPDGQLYLDLAGYAPGAPMEPIRALAALLAGLGVPADAVPVEVAAAATMYRSLLAGKRMLVVLDNAHSAEQVRPLLPGSPDCFVLITSRNRLAGLVATHGVRWLPLDVLALPEAIELLAGVLGWHRVAAEPAAAERLARACGLLPLALRIAAANLAVQPEQSISGYLTVLRAGDRLTGLRADGDAQAAIASAFDHSYRHLTHGGRRLFRLLGLVPGPDIGVPAAAALAGVTVKEVDRPLAELSAAHLVEARGAGRVALHDLLRLYARERADREDAEPYRAAALRRLLCWCLDSATAAADLLYPEVLRLPVPEDLCDLPADVRGRTALRDMDAAGAVAWLDRERGNLAAAVRHAAGHGMRREAWLLADALRGYFWLRRHAVEWLAVAEAGLAAAMEAGDAHARTAGHLSLAHAYAAVCRYPLAIEHCTKALKLARQAGWIDGEAASLGDLGHVYWQSGDLQGAAERHAQALALSQETGRPAGQAIALVNLGVVNRYLGRLHEAAGNNSQALFLYRRLGSRHGEAHALGNLGVTEHQLGRLDLARDHLTRTLALHREVGSRFGESYIANTLAAAHRDAGRYPAALEMNRAARELASDIGHRYMEAVSINTFASIQLCMRHPEEARELYERGLAVARQAEIRTPETNALLGLAAAALHTGAHRAAMEFAERAHAIAVAAGLRGMEGRAHIALAAAHHALGRPERALDHARRGLEVQRETGNRLSLARALRELGSIEQATGAAENALARWREALELFTDIGSPEATEVRRLLRTPPLAGG